MWRQCPTTTISIGDTTSSRDGPSSCGGIFEGANLQSQLSEIEAASAAPDFWSRQAEAQKVMQRRRRVEGDLALLESLRRRADDLGVLFEWAAGGEDVSADIRRGLDEL